MDGIANQNLGNFEAQQEYQPPPQQPGYGPPPGAPPPGAPYGAPPPMPPAGPMERPTGVTILAVLYFIQGILMLMVPIMFSICLGSMLSLPGVEESGGGDDLFAAGLMCWLVFGIIALVYFLIGFGLLKGKGWARVVAIILAIIGLLNVPIGTIISIIILIYLFKPEVKAYFQ